MKRLDTIVSISLNALFCAALLWFFSRNSFLRPYLGSVGKELLSGLMLLTILYANYLVLYPKLYHRHTWLYWFILVSACLVEGCVELAAGYTFISKCQAARINDIGAFKYFAKFLFLIFSRNLAFNFLPYMMGERKQMRQSLETEVKVVYKYTGMIDVSDDENNCCHIPVDDIFYCKKFGKETEFHTVDGVKYTRYCTIRYLLQLLDNKDFVRISSSIMVPFRQIASCDGETVVMKNVLWTETPITFQIDAKRCPQAADAVEEYLCAETENNDIEQQDGGEEKVKRDPSIPSKERLETVLRYIREHPGCRSTEIVAHAPYPKTTMERCLATLKKQGLVEYTGSKKTGGYRAVDIPPEETPVEGTRQEDGLSLELTEDEAMIQE